MINQMSERQKKVSFIFTTNVSGRCSALSTQPRPLGCTVHQRPVDLFRNKAMQSSTVTRTIGQLSWTAPDTPKGRPANFSIDAAVLKVLNVDPTTSVPEIAQEVKLSASTVFYVLTTRMDYIEDADWYRIVYLSRRRFIVSGKVMSF
jgi:hypothetical protein